MRIMVGIGHPKQVHFWKNIIHDLIGKGHDIMIVAWDKDITLHLLDAYCLKYDIIGKNHIGLIKKAYGVLTSELKILKIARRFNPDILVGGAPYLAHVGRYIGKPHISFTDTEHANLANGLSFPFTSVVATPSCYKGKINPKKQLKYNGYMELAYLHPNNFKPDSSVLDDMGLCVNDKYIIIRLISWNASHDNDSEGFSHIFLRKAIQSLEKYGSIFITSEEKLSTEFEKYEITFPPEKLHSALYYASLHFGEGGTTAVESALLGTPSVHVETFSLKSNKVVDATQIHGNFDELVNKYDLLRTYSNRDIALNEALKILKNGDAKNDLYKKRKLLFNEKIDVAAFMGNLIENYPESYHTYLGVIKK